MRIYLLSSALALIATLSNAATWERPAGAYTPTNNSVNTTKYQTDRANGVAISSVKVDGDINKAFQGLNDIEARVAPNVVGQSGKYLSNNGATAFWSGISGTSVGSGAATAGQVLKSNGSGASVYGLLDVTSFPNLGVAGTYSVPLLTLNAAGLVTAVTATTTISTTNISVSNSLLVTGTVAVSGSVSVKGSLTVSGSVNAPGVAKAWVTFDGTSGAIANAFNVSGVVRNSAGNYTITLSNTMPNTNYAVAASSISPAGEWTYLLGHTTSTVSMGVRGVNNPIDSSFVSVMVFGL